MASRIVRWNPVREMVAMQSAMDRMFDEVTRNFGDLPTVGNTLPLDVHENDAHYTIAANLPGLTADDIEITLHENTLTISGEFVRQEAPEGTREWLSERVFGKFSRTLTLPNAVDADAVEATYDNGVLTLTLPKAESARPRQIAVNSKGLLNNPN